MDKQEICRRTRRIASDSLCRALDSSLNIDKPISEAAFRDAWLQEMRKSDTILPDGWYSPPPHGMSVLFGTDDYDVNRVNYQSLRPPEKWPKDDIYLNKKNGLIYLYASPVDLQTGIIGDFGVTLYFGNKPEIKELLAQCLELDKSIFEYSKVGMKLSEIATYADSVMNEKGMSNEIVSSTDVTGSNIGHTIPAPMNEWSADDKSLFNNAGNDWDAVVNIINHKRTFTNPTESYDLQAGDAITIEPRPSVPTKADLPTSLSYHAIALYKADSENELLTDFEELFKLTGMDYML